MQDYIERILVVLNPDKTLTADRDEARAALADMTHRYEAATEQLQSGQVP